MPSPPRYTWPLFPEFPSPLPASCACAATPLILTSTKNRKNSIENRPVSLTPRRQDLEALAEKTRALLANTVSAATKRGYASDLFGDWKAWTESHNAPVIPAEPEWICLYLVDRSSTLKAATLARRLNAISYYHRHANCLLSPTHHPLVRETFKAIRREIGTKQKIKQALLTDDVRNIMACCPDSLAGKQDKALYLISFAGMLRREDSAGLMVEGLHFTSDGLVMSLDHGKTDQESHGREIAIVPDVNPSTCPLRALKDWLRAAKISSGPVFCGVDQKGRVFSSGLHRDSISYIIKRTASRAGMNIGGIAGHSLRSGGNYDSSHERKPRVHYPQRIPSQAAVEKFSSLHPHSREVF